MGFGVCCVLTVVVLVAGLWGMGSTAESLKRIEEGDFPLVGQIEEVVRLAGDVRALAMRVSLMDNENAGAKQYRAVLEELEGRRSELAEAKTELLRRVEAAGMDRGLVERFVEASGAVEESLGRLVTGLAGIAQHATLPRDPVARQEALIKLGDLHREYFLSLQRGMKAFEGLAGAAAELSKAGFESARQRIDGDLRRAGAARNLAIAVGVAAVVAGVVVAGGISAHLGGTVGRLKRTVEAVAQFDLSASSGMDQRDELGQLAKAVDEMAGRLRVFAGRLRGSAESLRTSSAGLAGFSEKLAASSQTMTEQAGSVAAAGEQLSATMGQMAQRAREVSRATTSVAAAIEEMNATIAEVARSCAQESAAAGEAENHAREAAGVIAELDQATEVIGKIVELIANIAGQTNLLALNATIEAANAGEAGRGFAVVANEVKELARQTADATKQIAEQVRTIRASSEKSVAAMGRMGEMIQNLSRIAHGIAAAVEEQSAAVGEVSKNISSISGAAQELSRNVEEAAEGAKQVSGSVHRITQAAADVAEGAQQTRTQAAGLKGLGEELNAFAGQFKV